VRLNKGYTLIELIMFMVIVTILSTTIFVGYEVAMSGAADVSNNARAMFIAEQRMDLIIGQKIKNGFSGFVDPCVSLFASPATDNICSKGSFAFGYTVLSSITTPWNANANLKLVTVTVSGPGSATLATVVGNY
jgi:type II secretory pathway pseudopilin PulG